MIGVVKTCEPIKVGCGIITHYNEHNPHDYLKKLEGMPDAEFFDQCKDMIWFSAYAANNGSSDFHWMCDACYAESNRRGKPEIYNNAHKRISGSV